MAHKTANKDIELKDTAYIRSVERLIFERYILDGLAKVPLSNSTFNIRSEYFREYDYRETRVLLIENIDNILDRIPLFFINRKLYPFTQEGYRDYVKDIRDG